MHRATNLTQKYCGGVVPDCAPEPAFDLIRLIADVNNGMEGFAIQDAILASLTAVKATNKYLSDLAPWHIKADPDAGFSEEDAAAKRSVVVRTGEAQGSLAESLWAAGQPLIRSLSSLRLASL